MRNYIQLSSRLVIALSLSLAAISSHAIAQQDGFGVDDFTAPQPTPLDIAIDSLHQAKTEPQRKLRLAEVRSKLSAQYDSYLAVNEAELKEMEQRLKNLRVQLKRRADAKDYLVDFELKRISNEAQGLTWPGRGGPGNAFGGGFDDGYGDGYGGLGMGDISGNHLTGKSTVRKRDQWLKKLLNEQAKMPTPDALKGPPARAGYSETEKLNDLKQIVLACLNYESMHQRLPSNIVAIDGTPLLSWRVAILPYIDEYTQNLYTKFRLNESWDSEHNKALLAKMPPIFKSLEDSDTNTCLLGFEFEGAMFEPDMKMTFGGITDGTSNTLYIIEAAADLAVEWTKPSDISLKDFEARNPEQLFMNEDGKGRLAMGDASSHAVDLKKIKSQLKNLIQRNDGTALNLDGLEFLKRNK